MRQLALLLHFLKNYHFFRCCFLPLLEKAFAFAKHGKLSRIVAFLKNLFFLSFALFSGPGQEEVQQRHQVHPHAQLRQR